MPEPTAQALVIGAGPGGLAAAAALGQVGIRAAILERADAVGASWRRHYDRLHLHTVRWLSGLPGLPIPRRDGRWVSREAFVAYLESYARHHRLDIRLGIEVERLARAGDLWRLSTSRGELSAAGVVVATGYNRLPHLPRWPGLEGFRGRLPHSSAYRSGAELAGRDVLVVGAGNSGAEIAVDLVEQGAARVRLSVRTPPNVVRRTVAGAIPTQLVSIALRPLPLPLSDTLARITARLTVGDLTRFGLPAPTRGVYTQMIRYRQIPILDVGLIAALRTGRIEVVPAVEGFDGASVLLRGGGHIQPEAVIAATGFRPALEALLDGLGLLDASGVPLVHGGRRRATGARPSSDRLHEPAHRQPAGDGPGRAPHRARPARPDRGCSARGGIRILQDQQPPRHGIAEVDGAGRPDGVWPGSPSRSSFPAPLVRAATARG